MLWSKSGEFLDYNNTTLRKTCCTFQSACVVSWLLKKNCQLYVQGAVRHLCFWCKCLYVYTSAHTWLCGTGPQRLIKRKRQLPVAASFREISDLPACTMVYCCSISGWLVSVTSDYPRTNNRTCCPKQYSRKFGGHRSWWDLVNNVGDIHRTSNCGVSSNCKAQVAHWQVRNSHNKANTVTVTQNNITWMINLHIMCRWQKLTKFYCLWKYCWCGKEHSTRASKV